MLRACLLRNNAAMSSTIHFTLLLSRAKPRFSILAYDTSSLLILFEMTAFFAARLNAPAKIIRSATATSARHFYCMPHAADAVDARATGFAMMTLMMHRCHFAMRPARRISTITSIFCRARTRAAQREMRRACLFFMLIGHPSAGLSSPPVSCRLPHAASLSRRRDSATAFAGRQGHGPCRMHRLGRVAELLPSSPP